MRFPRFIGIVRIAPVVVAFVLCFVAFLYPYQLAQPGIGTSLFTVPATAHSSSLDAEKPADGNALAVNYLAVSLEEAEAGNQSPVNAEHLTALLLVMFFGILLGVLGGKRTWHRKKAFSLTERRVTLVAGSPPRQLAPALLSVFIL